MLLMQKLETCASRFGRLHIYGPARVSLAPANTMSRCQKEVSFHISLDMLCGDATDTNIDTRARPRVTMPPDMHLWVGETGRTLEHVAVSLVEVQKMPSRRCGCQSSVGGDRQRTRNNRTIFGAGGAKIRRVHPALEFGRQPQVRAIRQVPQTTSDVGEATGLEPETTFLSGRSGS